MTKKIQSLYEKLGKKLVNKRELVRILKSNTSNESSDDESVQILHKHNTESIKYDVPEDIYEKALEREIAYQYNIFCEKDSKLLSNFKYTEDMLDVVKDIFEEIDKFEIVCPNTINIPSKKDAEIERMKFKKVSKELKQIRENYERVQRRDREPSAYKKEDLLKLRSEIEIIKNYLCDVMEIREEIWNIGENLQEIIRKYPIELSELEKQYDEYPILHSNMVQSEIEKIDEIANTDEFEISEDGFEPTDD